MADTAYLSGYCKRQCHLNCNVLSPFLYAPRVMIIFVSQCAIMIMLGSKLLMKLHTYIRIYIIQPFSLKYFIFWINVAKFMQALTKLDIPTFRKGSTEERTQRNKWKIWHSLGLEPRSSAYLAPMLYTLSYGCQWAELNSCPYKLSNLKFTLLPSLHMDIYSRHVDNSVFLFFLHNCPLLIPLHDTAVLIKICRFLNQRC